MRGSLLQAAAAAFVSTATVFVAKTYADSLFLAEFGARYIPHFIVGQGLLLASVAAGYGRLLKRGKALTFDILILAAVVLITATAPLLTALGRPHLFAVSLMIIAGTALGQMVVWNAATSVVSGRAARAFLPRAGAAATAGAVVGGFGSSAIVGVMSLEALAPVAGALTMIALGLRLFLRPKSRSRRISAQITPPRPDENTQDATRRLVFFLAAATIVEALLSAVIDFGFKRHVELAMDGNQDKMGLFFALFYGTSNVALLATQLFVASRLLATRSLKFSLGIQPAAQTVAAALWAVFPLLPLAALSRGIENVFKFGVARPAQEIALTPLPEIQRKRWKVLLRGFYGQGGVLAAGFLLIALAPLLASYPEAVPLLTLALAATWFLLQRRTAGTYRETLGSALGLRRQLRSESGGPLHLDRDSLGRIIELAGDKDLSVGRLAQELIDDLATNVKLLIPHLGVESERARATVYRVLASRPDRRCGPALRRAVAAESSGSSALADGLRALACHGDGAEKRRAAELAQRASEADRDGEAARFYLAATGSASHEELGQLFRRTIERSGREAALLAQALLSNGVESIDRVTERVVLAIDEAPSPAATREALFVAARLGHPALVGRLLRSIESGSRQAEAALSQLSTEGLERMAAEIAEQPVSSKTRKRFIRALRGLDAPEVTSVVAPYLLDPDLEVRDVAVHTLLSQIRRGHPSPPARIIARALEDQLERFAIYVEARTGSMMADRESVISLQIRNVAKGDLSTEAFFLDELDRRTEQCLSRLTDRLALTGDASTVYAAERALKSKSFKRRRQALDLLQETIDSRQRVRLIELLESYLLPAADPIEGARERVCQLDPWLEKCLEQKGEKALKLWTLRGAPLFDAAPGEVIQVLAEHCELIDLSEGEIIVEQGAPGDDLYILIRGSASVNIDGRDVARLGPNDAFGELALLDHQQRGATVRATQGCRALRLSAGPFRRAVDEQPEIGLGLLKALVKMLRAKV